MDWPLLISDLQARGLSLLQTARICGCAQGTLSDLKGGRTKEPAYALGQSLIKLQKASDREIARLLKQSDVAEAKAA
jgi:hypothetical protein